MPLMILRFLFLLTVLAVGMSYVEAESRLQDYGPYLIVCSLALGLAAVTIDITMPRKSLQAISGVFFGLLAGLVISYGLTLVLGLLASAFLPQSMLKEPVTKDTVQVVRGPDGTLVYDKNGNPLTEHVKVEIDNRDTPAVAITKVLLGLLCCYLCVSFILQTKDDVRFVIPYVEFAKQLKGQRPVLLDTSVIIDGRIVDICETGVIDQQLIVPRFVLNELQTVADSADKLKRNRGRRGLDILSKLQSMPKVNLQIVEGRLPKGEVAEGVDLKLVALAQTMNGRVATNDYNLNKLAKVRGIEVININDLANALKPVVLPGEGMLVKIIKPGEEPGQGIGYLDDGTMVVVEHGRSRMGDKVNVAVTSVLQTSAGRMIFGRMEGTAPQNGPQRRDS